MRVLFWVQHLLGSGHLKRAVTLAQAMQDEGLQVTLVNGGPPADWLLPPNMELVQLPSIRTRDRHFSALVDEADRPVDDALWDRRRAHLLELLARLEPRVLITEMFPFGRRSFGTELVPWLETAAKMRPKPWRLCSIRDILVNKGETRRYLWMRDMVLAHYDRVLVHTDPKLIPFGLTFPFADALQEWLIDTGYVVDATTPAVTTDGQGADGKGEVLVSAGGGRVGTALLEVAIEARALTRLRDAPWRLIAGGSYDEAALAALRAKLPPGMILERQRRDFSTLLANSLLSVSQAGYNTVVEGLRLGKPLVLVPFETDAETEQWIRAERVASLGLAAIVRERELTPSTLARAVDLALARPHGARAGFDFDGVAKSARIVRELADRSAERGGEAGPS